MALQKEIKKSVAMPQVLVQIDISQFNTQWVNHGAGIWAVASLNDYSWVDSSLLTGFTAQGFGAIGSVTVDGIPQQVTSALSDITGLPESFYYDSDTQTLYCTFINYDEPSLHTILIGVTRGLSTRDFTLDNGTFYDGRLASAPQISTSRDPLFWGRLAFDINGISIINSDGEYDLFGEDNNIYGNEVRIYYGFEGLEFADFVQLYTGYIDRLTIGEDQVSVSIADKRRQLTKPVQYSCTDKNALEAIEEILEDNYSIPYTSVFYDTTAWETAKALVADVTIDMQKEEPAIQVIEDICGTVFGIFLVGSDGKFGFKLIDETAPAETTIESNEILNRHTISYDPSEVITSVRVGYDKDWATTGSAYTFVEDVSRESEIFGKYKTYNQKEFLTLLATEAKAEEFASTVLDYAENVVGAFDITVPMKYNDLVLGDNINVEIMRETGTMLGMYKCEVTSKSYDLSSVGFIKLGLRIIGVVTYWVTEYGEYIIDSLGRRIVV